MAKRKIRNKSMKKIKKYLKQYFGEILLVIGSCITSYNVFGWLGAASWYRSGFLPWITIGVTLLVIGILIIRNKKQVLNNN